DRVEAEIAPQLQPQLVADVLHDRGAQAAGAHDLAEALDTGGLLAGGLADRELVAVDVLDDARLDHFGGRIDDAADGALGAQAAPRLRTGVDGLERAALEGAAELVEVPVGHAVDGGDDAGVVAEERLHGVDDARHRVRLQRDDDVVLRAEFLGIVGAVEVLDALLAVDEQLQAVLAHRLKMSAACNKADLGAGAGKLHAHISAD